jgi:hypothetical protein
MIRNRVEAISSTIYTFVLLVATSNCVNNVYVYGDHDGEEISTMFSETEQKLRL